MQFQPTDDQQAFRETAQRFAREKLAESYQKRATEHVMDRGLIKEMGALGLIGADLPEEFGGLGESSVTAGLIVEEIARADFNVSYIQLLGSLMGGMVAKHALPDIAKEWVPRVTAGEAVIGLGLTEPRGGSDAANLQLRAAKSGNGWRLNGEKTSMSFAAQADAAVVFARTGDPEGGSRGVSAFLVDLNEKGINRTHFDDIGTKPVGRGSVFFDDVFVPSQCLMAEQDRAFGTIMAGFDYSRALIGLECLGAARASVDETWTYVQEREAFGAPLAQYQGVSFPLVEAETQLTMMRQLCYYTLDLRDRGLPHTKEAAMCKWYVPKTACEIIHQCLILHGHYGYTTDLPHHQRYNDVLGLQIGDGTAQIQKLVIAREKVGRMALQYDKKAKGGAK
ncbi:acyl-CoA dehydrogenase family protein [Neoaquamicrobium sediminum]|uniref:Acyl-CoA dehydrogenase family protein n=1 Tax=Neoaquamicrobium sediminum TaxID=1849104 RepID=A0ABV3WYD4_9HYPH|nr:acyl-CoA dehydrogenase family protein [Mesorhizobium sediminum]MCV0398327.1 acyl-CoA dehydrogenase family protein [Rhizobiaceae bacterium]MCV0406669.1 acyl-CoA dehydrogenase family protein [Rhizobiaceae bacterium]NRC57125.1 cyclohexanecarboxyl-CoA dehydrogenase [Mesorhizobium sediminum]